MTISLEEHRFEDAHESFVAEPATRSRTTFSPELANRLLELLSSDDEFRARFQENPRSALRQLGHETPEANRGTKGLDPVVEFSHFQGGLASKEKIAAARDVMMRTYLEGKSRLAFSQFDICA